MAAGLAWASTVSKAKANLCHFPALCANEYAHLLQVYFEPTTQLCGQIDIDSKSCFSSFLLVFFAVLLTFSHLGVLELLAELLEQLLPVLQYKATWSNEIAGHKYQAAAIARALKVIDKTLLEMYAGLKTNTYCVVSLWSYISLGIF